MTHRILNLLVLLLLCTSAYAQVSKVRAAHIGLVYPLSTNGVNAREYTNVVSLHAIVGVSRSETSLCASGFSSVIYDRGNGLIMAGFSNHILNSAHGLQAAGFVNTVRNSTKGLQASGFLNLTGSIKGMQAAGFCNIALVNVNGFQSAGFCNLVTGNVHGVQASGFLNTADNVDGAQVAGFANVADDVNTQVAGFVNIARNVKGVQMAGFVNIAQHSDYPVGLVNLIKDGTKAMGVSIDESGTMLASFRSGGKKLYGILGVGYNLKSKDDLYALEGGIGLHIHVVKTFEVNIEGVSEALADFQGDTYYRSSMRVLPTITLAKRVGIFAGPAISHMVTDNYSTNDVNTHYLWSHKGLNSFNALYVGAIGGVQVHF